MEEHKHNQTDAKSSSNKQQLHIAMFPWLAFGHMMPFLHLSNLISQKGHKVSFLSTPLNIHRLQTTLLSSSSSSSNDAFSTIDFVKLNFRQHPDLPQNAESTADVTYKQVHALFQFYDWLQDDVALFLDKSKPDWIIQDFASPWLGPIAHQLGIKCAQFSIFKVSSMSVVPPPKEFCGFDEYRTRPEDYTKPPKWIPFTSNMAFHFHEVVKVFDNMEPDDTGTSPYDRVKESTLNSDIILVRSCQELESEWFSLMQTLWRRPILPVGLLPAVINYSTSTDAEDKTWTAIKAWLDTKKTGSVVYVAFGSETKLSQSDVTELALGLEMSKLPFIWALKTDRGLADDEPVELPKGFEDRVGESCMVCTSWVPQLKILSHDAVGVVLFHSGWSTAIEAVQFGKSMVLLPLQSDQPLVARLLEAKQLGYCLPRDEKDGSFTKEIVANAVRLVVVEEAGKVYREKVMEMQGLFSDMGKQDRYVEDMIEYLLLH